MNDIKPTENQFFIIGGTIKAATSSLFNYLNAHPQICGSKVKETYFFSQYYTGNLNADRKKYNAYFSPDIESKVLFEASPNYLAFKENVAPRIKKLNPGTKLLFILRNPVDRLYSHFNFAKGKLQITESMEFEEFITLCKKFNANEITSQQAGILETHLRALEIGNYGNYLQNFYDVFDSENIKVIFFDDLNKRPFDMLVEISDFIGVDPSFYKDFEMKKANVTFSARNKILHFFSLIVNRLFESVFHRYPGFKRLLVGLYKKINQKQQGYVPMKDTTRKGLTNYYKLSNAKVKTILQTQSLPTWIDNN